MEEWRKGQEKRGRKEGGRNGDRRKGGGRMLIICSWAVVVIWCHCGRWSLWGVW